MAQYWNSVDIGMDDIKLTKHDLAEGFCEHSNEPYGSFGNFQSPFWPVTLFVEENHKAELCDVFVTLAVGCTESFFCTAPLCPVNLVPLVFRTISSVGVTYTTSPICLTLELFQEIVARRDSSFVGSGAPPPPHVTLSVVNYGDF